MAAAKAPKSFTVPTKRKVKQALREMEKAHKAMELKIRAVRLTLERGNFRHS